MVLALALTLDWASVRAGRHSKSFSHIFRSFAQFKNLCFIVVMEIAACLPLAHNIAQVCHLLLAGFSSQATINPTHSLIPFVSLIGPFWLLKRRGVRLFVKLFVRLFVGC